MQIDSHHHFWQYNPAQYGWIGPDMSVLKHNFLPDVLRHEIADAGIDGVVSVQARQTIEETEWLTRFAQQHDFIKGVVGWVPLASPDLERIITPLAASPWLNAVRHVVQDEPADDFILGADFNRGIKLLSKFNLVYDILIYARQLTNAIRFVDQHPNQSFVLDHIAKPTIATAQFDEAWATGIRELAKRDNVVCKFSGVATEVRDANWCIEVIRPYWDVALEAFGPRRLMFGSDWPVCLLRTGYDNWVATVRQLAVELTDDDRRELFGGTAVRAYGLKTD